MQLIIVLCLIAKLALVSGDCDVGKTVNDFDYNKFTGTWYFLYYLPNENDDNLQCVVDTYCVPDGDKSKATTCAYDKREEKNVTYTGCIRNWNNTGFCLEYDTDTIWAGRWYIAAVDYERYFIGKVCWEESNEVLIYVAFRCAHPDDATMKDVKNALSDNGIPFDQLQRWNADRS